MVPRWRERKVVITFPSLLFPNLHFSEILQREGLNRPWSAVSGVHEPLGLCWHCWLESRSVTKFWVRFIIHAACWQKVLPKQLTKKPGTGRPTVWSASAVTYLLGLCSMCAGAPLFLWKQQEEGINCSRGLRIGFTMSTKRYIHKFIICEESSSQGVCHTAWCSCSFVQTPR